jgi:hypothetical protein
MNQQQLAAVRHMVEALEQATPHLPVHTDWHFEAIAAGKALLEQPEPVQPLSGFVRAGKDAKAEIMDGVIDDAIEAQKQLLEQPADHCEDVLHMVRPQNCGTGYCSCIERLFKKGGA